MSKTRLSQLSESKLETDLAALEQQLSDIRSNAPQLVGGSSVRYYTSQAPGDFDWTGTIPIVGGVSIKLFLITATAMSMDVLYGLVTVDTYQTSSTNKYGGLGYMNDVVAGRTPVVVNIFDAPNSLAVPNQKAWTVRFIGDTTQTLWVKFHVIAIDKAGISVTVLI